MKILCAMLEVSQSGYYDSLNRPESGASLRKKELTRKVKSIFNEHEKRYGRIRIFKQLKKEGVKVSEKTVGSIMRSEKLVAKKKRPFRPITTQSSQKAKHSPNLLKNQPKPTKPNLVIVNDITYVPTREGWLYLAGAMDLYSHVIKGWSISENMKTELINTALDKALRRYPALHGSISHSDRGCQYTSHEYQNKLNKNRIKSSMSAKGNCYDNAEMESFWSTLKTECFPENGIFETREEAKQAIFEYIEGYYNTIRMHSSLDYKTPLEAEKEAA